MDLVALLSGSPLFEMLSNHELEVVCAMLTPRRVDAGAVIFNEGELGDGLYLVSSGEVEIFRSGKQTPIATLSVGECFGEMALIDKAHRSATVKARTDAQLLYLSAEHLAQFRQTNKDGFSFLVMNIARLLSTRLRETNRRLAEG